MGLLKNKRALIVGAVNNYSIAYGIAKCMHREKAELAFTYQSEKIKERVEKIAEEIQEVKEATNESELNSEIGDLFFALVNLARWKKVDAESALRGTSVRFKKRFAFVEKGAKNQGKKLSEMSIDEMESLWQKAKEQ